jgi:adenine-specific DNA-methyltransferase
MTSEFPEKIPLASMDVAARKREELRRVLATALPEAVIEDKIDLDQVRRALGEWVEPDRERFGLNWPGRAACLKVIQAPSVGTLTPVPDESIDWEETQNLFIEGDNLEVLKLLQKAYFAKLKMIFIDPPYNTGHEFIYPDKYAETLDTYLEYTNQIDDRGRKFSTNADTSGRFHSRWLSMIYPRLYLAKNLLRDDGIIFISIDDNEQSNLRQVCDQIFGEENFVSQIVWQHSVQPKGYTDIFSVHHNYILAYSKSDQFNISPLSRTEKDNKNYSNPDSDPRGAWRFGDVRNALYRRNLIYPIFTPSGARIDPPENGWRWSKETLEGKIKTGEIYFSADESRIVRKIYLADQEGRAPETIWFSEDVGSTRKASQEIKELFGGEAPFDTAKPTQLIERMMQLAGVRHGDYCLDFFAGSASTGHACLASQTGCRFILVQLPEPVDEGTPHGKAASALGLRTVAEVSKERLRRAISSLQRSTVRGSDLGFRVFKLDRSAFAQWRGDVEHEGDAPLLAQIAEHASHLGSSASPGKVLYEILLKDGFSLAEKIDVVDLKGKNAYSIAQGALIVCLDMELTQESIDAIADLEPSRVICLDVGFRGNDQLKANAVQTFKARARSRETAIEFRTV